MAKLCRALTAENQPMSNKIHNRWQRQNKQHHMSKAERIRKMVKAMQGMEPTKLTREGILESWDMGCGPSRSHYTFHGPGIRGHRATRVFIDGVEQTTEPKRTVHRVFSEMEFKVDPETVEAMRLAGERLAQVINQMCEGMGIPPHFMDMRQPKTEPTTEVLINGEWVPVQQE